MRGKGVHVSSNSEEVERWTAVDTIATKTLPVGPWSGRGYVPPANTRLLQIVIEFVV